MRTSNTIMSGRVDLLPCITAREQEILSLISNGYSTKEIADHVYLSQHTVCSYRKTLLRKFNARNTAHLVRVGMESNFI